MTATKSEFRTLKDSTAYDIWHYVELVGIDKVTAIAHFSGHSIKIHCFGFGARKDIRI